MLSIEHPDRAAAAAEFVGADDDETVVLQSPGGCHRAFVGMPLRQELRHMVLEPADLVPGQGLLRTRKSRLGQYREDRRISVQTWMPP